LADSASLAAQRRVFDAHRAQDVETLISVLGDDPENRAWAARYLGKIGDPRAVAPLIRLLSVRDFQARAAAARALGKLRAVEAIPALLESVDSGPEDVMRAWAIDALGRIGSDEAAPKLIGLLENPHAGLRCTAAAALGRIGDARALPELRQAAARERWRHRRPYRRAIRAIEAKQG
jgi:HEAT repeat protein